MKFRYFLIVFFALIFLVAIFSFVVARADDVNMSVEVMPGGGPGGANDFTASPSPGASLPLTESSPLELNASPSASPADTQAPTAPTNLRATELGAITLTLAWDASTDDMGVKGYEIYNAETKILVGITANTTYNFVGLTPNTTYKFFVRAFDAVPNYSPNSEVLTINTLTSRTEEEREIERRGGVAAFLVLGGVPAEVAVGQPFSSHIKLTAADVGGNIVKGYAQSVFFTSTDSLARLAYSEAHPYTFTKEDVGIHEFAPSDFVLNTAGRQTLMVSDYSLKSSVELKVSSSAAGIFKATATEIGSFFSSPEQLSKSNLVLGAFIALAVVMPTLVNFFAGLNNFWVRLLYGLNLMARSFGRGRRRKTWGVVFNAQTGQPIPLAMVKLLAQDNHLVELSISDRQGRYGFANHWGAFRLKVSRVDFIFPAETRQSSFYERIYDGSLIKMAEPQQSVIFNLPLEPHATSRLSLTFWLWFIKLNHLLQRIRLPLFALGAVLALLMVIINFGYIYAVFLGFCLLLIMVDLRALKKAIAKGVVNDVYARPLADAIVRIYHKEDNRLLETALSDKRGRFSFRVNPGVYYLVATKPKFVDTKTHLMYLEKGQKKETITAINIKLKKL